MFEDTLAAGGPSGTVPPILRNEQHLRFTLELDLAKPTVQVVQGECYVKIIPVLQSIGSS
eukprot:COSAG02_NODE_6523_length_3521_cov_17.829632_1_plen_59_part_10